MTTTWYSLAIRFGGTANPWSFGPFMKPMIFRVKTVIPFATSGGSDLQDTMADMKRYLPASVIGRGLCIGSYDVNHCQQKIQKWIHQLGVTQSNE